MNGHDVNKIVSAIGDLETEVAIVKVVLQELNRNQSEAKKLAVENRDSIKGLGGKPGLESHVRILTYFFAPSVVALIISFIINVIQFIQSARVPIP